MMTNFRPIGIYHEHQDWFRPLFAELDRRGIRYERIDARRHSYDLDGHDEAGYSVVLNRMSPSASLRDAGHSILHTQSSDGVELTRGACPADAPKNNLRVEAFTPPDEVVADVEKIMTAAGIEIGGVEYIVDDRDGQRYYYDINALSNFVADAPRVLGFDPFARLADWLEREQQRADETPMAVPSGLAEGATRW